MSRKILMMFVLTAVACGGRSKMRGPETAAADAAVVPVQPDGHLPLGNDAKDAVPPLSDGPAGPERGPVTPDVPPPDGLPPGAPDLPVERRSDLPTDPPPLPPPDGLPPWQPDLPGDPRRDGPPDLPPWSPDLPPMYPDVPREAPPVLPDLPIDLPPFRPDVPIDRPPIRPDVPTDRTIDLPPPQQCVAGAACTADCSAACGMIGVMACACLGGQLACSDCQQLPITLSPDPCPSSPSGKECSSSGLACIAYGSSGIAGACLCMSAATGASLRWSCIIP